MFFINYNYKQQKTRQIIFYEPNGTSIPMWDISDQDLEQFDAFDPKNGREDRKSNKAPKDFSPDSRPLIQLWPPCNEAVWQPAACRASVRTDCTDLEPKSVEQLYDWFGTVAQGTETFLE